MTEITRAIALTGGIVNMETGEFPLVLASEGEASDGHIFSVQGARTPDRLPMLFAHESTPQIPSLGSMHSLSKEVRDGVRVMPAVGAFNLEGDGPLAAVRRDFAQLANDGDLPAASVRWIGESVSRNSLDRSSPFFAERGMFFPEPVPKEGSLVAIGADPKALLGRADHADSESQRLFWRVLANCEQSANGQRDVASAFQAFEESLAGLKAVGCTPDDVVRIAELGSDPVFAYEAVGKCVMLPAPIYQHVTLLERELLSRLLEQEGAGREAVSEIEAGREVVSEEASREVASVEVVGREATAEVVTPERAFMVSLARGLANDLGPAIGKSVAEVLYQRTGKR